MEVFWKTSAGVLLALVLGMTLGKQEKDLALVLTLGATAMAGAAGLALLEPVLEFLGELRELGQLSGETLTILLKVLGIGLVTQITAMLCRDGGAGSLGQARELLGSALILRLSRPLFSGLLDLIRRILGGL